MSKIALTDKAIKALKAPEDGQLEITDAGLLVSGLVLMLILGRRTRAWQVRYRFKGARRRKVIGHYPSMSLYEARSKAMEIAYEVDSGADPFAAPDSQGGITFDQLAELWRSSVEASGDLRTWGEYWRCIVKDFLPVWTGRPAADIEQEDVETILRRIAYSRNRLVMADRSKAAASAVFRWGRKRGLIKTNPTAGIESFGATGVDERTLTWDEAIKLWKLWDADPEIPARVLQLTLLTGQRGGEVMNAEWAELEESGWWTIPGGRTKNRREHRVWLGTDLAQRMLSRLNRNTPWLFPSQVKEGPVQGVRKTILRFRRLSGVTDWSIKHLRKTMATRAAESGIDPMCISLMLNHTLEGLPAVTRRHYNRYHYDPQKREGWETFAAELSKRLQTD